MKKQHKLKNLKITKVDFVDAGANQRANIMLKKRAPEGFKEAFEYAFNKFAGLHEVSKKAMSFNETMESVRLRNNGEKICDAMYALRDSIFSIINDEDVEDKAEMLNQTIDSFADACKEIVGEIKSSVSKQEPHVEPAKSTPSVQKSIKTEREEKEVKIDKSKMTPAERAFYEEIEKRYGVKDEPAKQEPQVAKSAPVVEQKAEQKSEQAKESANEVLKKFAPDLVSMMDEVKKKFEKQEDDEIMNVAKRYELLGKKPEELAPVLKNVKKASKEAYDQLVGSLDSVLEVVKKSGAFSETGKNGHGETDAMTIINKRAAEIQASNPALSIYQARDRAFQEHPELIKDFE